MSLTVSPHDLAGLAQPVADLGRFVWTSNGELHIRGREDEASRSVSAMSEPAAVIHVGHKQDTLRAEGRPVARNRTAGCASRRYAARYHHRPARAAHRAKLPRPRRLATCPIGRGYRSFSACSPRFVLQGRCTRYVAAAASTR